MHIDVICFGPLAEHLGWKSRSLYLEDGSTARQVIDELGISEWLTMGLCFAVDGNMTSPATILNDGSELALLPPVSGG